MDNKPKKLKSELKILQWNSRSINNKLDELKSIANKYDIILISETWLNPEKTIKLPNYNIIRKDRLFKCNNQDDHGGVCIFIKKNLQYKDCSNVFKIQEKIEITAVTIQLEQNEKLVICSIYRPPNCITNATEWKNFFDQASKFKYAIIGGDFNTHHTQWGSYKICTSGQSLSDTLLGSDFTICNDGSTTCIRKSNERITQSAIDLTIVSSNLYLNTKWTII